MGLLLLITGFGLLTLPASMHRLGRRLPPDEWAWLVRWALLAGAITVELGCVLYAAPTVFRALGVPALAKMCRRILAGFLPGGATAGWAAAAAAVTLVVLAGTGRLRARRTYRTIRAEPWLGQHRAIGDHELVILPTSQPVAVSVAGRPGQILVSTGLVDALSDPQLDLVVSHEDAHLRFDHQRSLQLAAALDHAFAFYWPLRRSTAVLRLALERWADEAAAGDEPDRRADLRAALLGVSALTVGVELAALSAADTVLERLDALDRPPAGPSKMLRSAVYLSGLGFWVMLLVSLAGWAGQARMVIAMAGRCTG